MPGLQPQDVVRAALNGMDSQAGVCHSSQKEPSMGVSKRTEKSC